MGMMQGNQLAYNSTLGGVATGTNPSTSFTVPTGCIFKGVVSLYGQVSAGGLPCAGTLQKGSNTIYWGNQSNPGAAANVAASQYVELDEGAWTIASLVSFSAGAGNIAYHGMCWKK